MVYKGREDLTEDNYLSEVKIPIREKLTFISMDVFFASKPFCPSCFVVLSTKAALTSLDFSQVAVDTDRRTLAEALDGADVFLGEIYAVTSP